MRVFLLISFVFLLILVPLMVGSTTNANAGVVPPMASSTTNANAGVVPPMASSTTNANAGVVEGCPTCNITGAQILATPGSVLQKGFTKTSTKGNTVTGHILAYEVRNASLPNRDNDPNNDYYLLNIMGRVDPKPSSDWSADTTDFLSDGHWTMQFDAFPAGGASVEQNALAPVPGSYDKGSSGPICVEIGAQADNAYAKVNFCFALNLGGGWDVTNIQAPVNGVSWKFGICVPGFTFGVDHTCGATGCGIEPNFPCDGIPQPGQHYIWDVAYGLTVPEGMVPWVWMAVRGHFIGPNNDIDDVTADSNGPWYGAHDSSATLSCSPSNVVIQQPSTCTASIADTCLPGVACITASANGPTTPSSSESSATSTSRPSVVTNSPVTPLSDQPHAHPLAAASICPPATNQPPCPNITRLYPLTSDVTAIVGLPVTFNVLVSDTDGDCDLGGADWYVNGNYGPYPGSNYDLDHCSGGASKEITFNVTGTFSIQVDAFDDYHSDANGDGRFQYSPYVTWNVKASYGGIITPIIPKGSVTFSSIRVLGSFSPPSCNLDPSGQCSVTFTPSASGTATVTASYGGDDWHFDTSGTATIIVDRRSTSTTVSCIPSSATLDQATTCTATLSDSSPGATIIPTGTVTFTPSGSCTLSRTGSSAACPVSITPTGSGTLSVCANYSGDTVHTGSDGCTDVIVTGPRHSTFTNVSCSPDSITGNEATTCTATVTDTSSSPSTPTGTVSFTTNSTGAFSPGSATCSLIGGTTAGTGSCSVSYTPTVTGHHLITGSYHEDPTHSSSDGAFNLATSSLTHPDFSLSAVPTSVTIQQGSSGTSTITLTPLFGFTGTATLSTPNLPDGITTAFSYSTISSSQSSVVTIAVASSVGPGSYTVHVSGTSNSQTHSIDVTISVASAPEFTISAPQSGYFTEGSSVSMTVSFSGTNEFTGPITLSSSSPNGLVCSLNPSTVSTSQTATLNCNGDTPGTYVVVITGVSGSVTRTTTVSVTVASNRILGLDPPIFYGALVGIVALIVVGGMTVALRRRKR